jgi:hypothetical protein
MACECRQQYENDHREHVFDDQPSNRDVTRGGVKLMTVREHADQDHGAGNGERQAEDNRRRPAPAEHVRGQCAERGGDETLQDRAWDRHSPHGQQFVEMELQPDPEHQEDDADFSELLGEMNIRRVAGRVGANDDSSQEVTDDR